MRAERFKAVSILDEALEMSMAERMDYASHRDYSKIAPRLRPGSKPVIFHVREVPHGLWEEFVDAADSYPEKYRRAFQCGVELVENLQQSDGVTLGNWKPNTRNIRANVNIMNDDDLRLFSPAERQEIGSVIYTHSFLGPRIPATYLLPSSLQEPMINLDVRRALASRANAAVTISGAHSGRSTQNPDGIATDNAPPAADSDSPTDANAAIAISH